MKMHSSPYESLQQIMAELRKLAQAGDWESAVHIVDQLNRLNLPHATVKDRNSIEAAIRDIAEIEEKAEYLHDDLFRLLKVFEKTRRNG